MLCKRLGLPITQDTLVSSEKQRLTHDIECLRQQQDLPAIVALQMMADHAKITENGGNDDNGAQEAAPRVRAMGVPGRS